MDLIFLSFNVGVSDNHKPHKTENASSINIPSTAKNNELLDRSTFNTSYLLLGLISVLCLLLFAFIVYICKKFKTSRRENSNCVEKHTHDGPQIQDQQSNEQLYKSVSESAKTEQVYRPLDSKYEEINETLLIRNSRLSQTSSDDYVQPSVSSEHLLHTNGITDSDFPMKDVRAEQSLESSLSVNIFNPIILEINPCDIKDKNAYLDIIE